MSILVIKMYCNRLALAEITTTDITETDIGIVLEKAGIWKAPGVDEIHKC